MLTEKMALVGRLCYNKQNARFLGVPMAIHESGQMYLETIYILSQDSAFVRAIDAGLYQTQRQQSHVHFEKGRVCECGR